MPPTPGAWSGDQPPPPPPPPGTTDRVVYRYGAPPPGRPARAPYALRASAFVIDSIVVLALPAAAVVVLRAGPREIRTCEITEDGTLAVFEEGVTTGLCEVPTATTFGAAGLVGALGVVVWFAYVAWEGASTQTLGKRLMRIRTVDIRTGEPIGSGRNIGRNVLRGLMTVFVVFSVIDHLWPLWDRDGQTLHDKATSAAVVPVGT